MASPKSYSTAGAFRAALEERLKGLAGADKADINRLRRRLSFDRLLSRLFLAESPPWALKGGYALELRFRNARSTIDIDLTVERLPVASDKEDSNRIIREMLQDTADTNLGDWFEFKIGPPIRDLDAAPYGGARYPVEVSMDARIFARFHLDVGIGDVVMHPLEHLECRDWLSFAGIGRSRVLTITREQQFAEKIHAYTLPRNTPNSRVKDLVDLALLCGSDNLISPRILQALHLTFERRATHPIPATLSAPPPAWQLPFQALAEECRLMRNMADVFITVQDFYQRCLADLEADLSTAAKIKHAH